MASTWPRRYIKLGSIPKRNAQRSCATTMVLRRRWHCASPNYRLARDVNCLKARAPLRSHVGFTTFLNTITALQTVIKYDDDDLAGARATIADATSRARVVAQLPIVAAITADLAINAAAVDYKEGRFDEARAAFAGAAAAEATASGASPPADLAFNVALCDFALSNSAMIGGDDMAAHAQLISALDGIIERSSEAHPELGRSRQGGGGIHLTYAPDLRGSALVESINLRAAVFMRVRQWGAAR